MEYRVRKGLVSHWPFLSTDVQFIAERRIRFLGVRLWWWPVINGRWRKTAEAAKLDAENDRDFRRTKLDAEYLKDGKWEK